MDVVNQIIAALKKYLKCSQCLLEYTIRSLSSKSGLWGILKRNVGMHSPIGLHNLPCEVSVTKISIF